MLLRSIDNVYIAPASIVWIDAALFGPSTCQVRTSTGELFRVPAAEARRVLGVKRSKRGAARAGELSR
jgi:hypothetical protein